jgi:hypothetical protein
MDQDRLAEAIVREAAEAIVVSDPNGVIAAGNGGAERRLRELEADATAGAAGTTAAGPAAG